MGPLPEGNGNRFVMRLPGKMWDENDKTTANARGVPGMCLSRTVYYVLTVSVCLVLFSGERFGQAENDRTLSDAKYDFNVEQKTFRQVLDLLAEKHKIPVGLYVSSSEPNSCRQPIDLSISQEYVGEIMDWLMESCPAYSWTIVDSTINIVPINETAPLLDIVIPEFDAKDKTPEEIVDLIFELEEVELEMRSLGVGRDTTTILSQGKLNGLPRHSIVLKNARVRDILNYIIKNTEAKSWILYKLESEDSLISLRVY